MNNEQSKNVLKEKSYAFALRIIKAYKYLAKEQGEYVLSKQLLRCGTAIGALVREAEYAQSKADFVNKMSIALKEANETEYWVLLLQDSEYITATISKSVLKDCRELLRLLVSSTNTAKKNMNIKKRE
ncbi:MAG: four helix bundle protein [Prevotellaceae bacterium]|jgi:four helix bundle protein|nr:four helix bundle protein [Prevotellaceae bacterium]